MHPILTLANPILAALVENAGSVIFARSGIVGDVLCAGEFCRNREDQLSGARLLQSRSDMKEGPGVGEGKRDRVYYVLDRHRVGPSLLHDRADSGSGAVANVEGYSRR